MNEFEKQFEVLKSFLEFEDYNILTKRIVDLTLDTENIESYKSTNDFLNWLDKNENNSVDKKEKFNTILTNLHEVLSKKSIVERKTLIVAEEIYKTYGRNSFSLGPINLELKQGEILGLIGENGNGKTTLLRLLCGELFASAGKLNFLFDKKDQYDLRTKLVYIPQRTDTWYGSMFENLQFTASSYGYKPEENELVVELIIARLGLRKFRNHAWKSLSSGYKMRFELARMLLRKPQILLIDEPLANLDILAQQTILEDFKSIAKSPFRPIAIVMSSQQLYEVEKTSDQVVFLKNGVQKNLFDKLNTENKDQITIEKNLVVEFESSSSQSQLKAVFDNYKMISLQYNGGNYIVTFDNSITIHDLMSIMVQNKIQVQYFRNISNSSRQFFVS